ncbi:fatty acid synthase subunit beta [Puccinia sorghi]|uniref:Fatty acid synthase subunit beta n=1 Tax=Puccinia sorghi TaxID=27349 RepID=A0A0L6V268_9BASI|nr:fatty acid synthase subunit beta [Puccinia sorghi]
MDQEVAVPLTALTGNKTLLLHKWEVHSVPSTLHNFPHMTLIIVIDLAVLTKIASTGTTFDHKKALSTGVSKACIGAEIRKGLLDCDYLLLPRSRMAWQIRARY